MGVIKIFLVWPTALKAIGGGGGTPQGILLFCESVYLCHQMACKDFRVKFKMLLDRKKVTH